MNLKKRTIADNNISTTYSTAHRHHRIIQTGERTYHNSSREGRTAVVPNQWAVSYINSIMFIINKPVAPRICRVIIINSSSILLRRVVVCRIDARLYEIKHNSNSVLRVLPLCLRPLPWTRLGMCVMPLGGPDRLIVDRKARARVLWFAALQQVVHSKFKFYVLSQINA